MNGFAKRAPVLSLHCSGWLLILSGAAHLALFASSGTAWEGDTSLRKPILFGISAGVTLLSIGWLVPKLKPRWGDGTLWLAFSTAMTVEVMLITLQQWRGVPSHFNRSTSLDATILNVIEALILFVTVVIADLTWRSLRHLTASSADMKLSIQGGMVLLLVGCLLGVGSAIYGAAQKSLGKPPGIYGQAGVMKFAHGMPLHAIQFLPIIAWVMAKLQVGEPRRATAICLSLSSLVLLTVFSCLQTFSGRARFDTTLLSKSLLLVAAILFVAGPIAAISKRFTRADAR